MFRFIGRRVVQMFFLFLIFLTLVWLLLQAMPGDITDTLIGDPSIPLSTRLELADRLGLNQPLYLQYWTYITNFFTGEMGVSFSRYPQDVSTILFEAIPRTLVLVLSATLLAYWMGFKSGKLIAWGRGGKTEQGFIVGGIFLQTVFYPWFAIVMLWTFGFFLGWFPIGRFIDVGLWQGSGFDATEVFTQLVLTTFLATIVYVGARYLIKRTAPDLIAQQRLQRVSGFLVAAALVAFWYFNPARSYVWDIVFHTILPVMTLGLVAFGAVMLITRTSMLETLGEDYILTARAKGLPKTVIRDNHAARNALLPVVTSFILAMGTVVGGAIITEQIFSWPGMGLLFLQGIVVSDIPLVTGALAITGVLTLVAHLVVDIVYTFLDPRIRVS
ncbi:MAG TPA: ABC transporter permease [Acidimicrobiia bacterium]|nr:ABC transporter permease [Acidimicrobiia bacterium]